MTDCDVLVAGAGGAGLAAALAAADAGRRVVVVEAKATFRQGSNTAMSTSMIPAAGTRWQASFGEPDSPDQFLEDIRVKTEGTADEVVARMLADVGAELVAWLADDLGVPLELVTEFRYPGHTALRCHSVPDRSGATLLRYLLAAVGRRDAIDLVVPAQLTELLTTDDGEVHGAVITRPDGGIDTVTASSVVLATNGYGADRKLLTAHAPEIADAIYHGGEGSRGDAVRLAERHGYDVSHLDAYQGHGSLAVPHAILLTWAAIMHGGIIIDRDGVRFGDETVGYSEYATAVLARPGGQAWVVFDTSVHEQCLVFKDYLDLVESGAVLWASDVPALASVTSLPEDTLRDTLEQTHRAAVGDGLDPFGRVAWERPLVAPYAAVRVTGALFHTQGGLRIDGKARVLAGGVPVPGLFAAGGAAVGISGIGASGYLAGNGLLAALGLGYLAGTHA